MTEDGAKEWVRSRVEPDAFAGLSRYVDLLAAGARQHNLIAPSTLPVIWSRHIVDSLQLVELVPRPARTWLDIGSGAGLPGMVVALATEFHVTLSEPRALRVEFLRQCVATLGLGERVQVEGTKAQLISARVFDVISARAVTTSAALFEMSRHLAASATTHIFPKGASAEEDVYATRQRWSGTFHVEHSVIDPTSGIVVATGVRRK